MKISIIIIDESTKSFANALFIDEILIIDETINILLKQFFAITFKKRKFITIDVNFQLRDKLSYYVKKNIFKLYIFNNCEKKIFKLIYDDCFHVDHHRVYARLIKSIYIHKLFKKLTTYIRHCSTYELNQTKRYRLYEKLTFFYIFFMSFHILIMNWIVIFSINKKDFDCTSNVTCKFNWKMFFFEKITYFATKWVLLLLNRLQIVDWNVSSTIIFDRDFKFFFDFWTTLFKLLDTNLFFNFAYHFQTNNLSKRINQIFEIALRYFITKHSTLNWINVLFTFQLIFNNSFNAFIERFSNEIVYEFKMREVIHAIMTFFLSKNINVDAKR